MYPQCWKHLSLGEEQSEGHFSALEWSPPGLAKHGRCLLAVLTSNHVLALYECVGRPEIIADWQRVYIVNHALQAHFRVDGADIADYEASGKEKARSRIRSFAWSQIIPSYSQPGFTGASSALSHSYLAVSNDAGEVMLLQVTSPHDILSPETNRWHVSVAHEFKAEPNIANMTPIASCLPRTVPDAKLFVDQLAWSPWSEDASGNICSILSYTAQSRLQSRLVKANPAGDGMTLELGAILPRVVDETIAKPAGPMRWVPKANEGGDMYLVYPCRKILYCLVFHLRKANGIRVTKQRLENAWDELSGQTIAPL